MRNGQTLRIKEAAGKPSDESSISLSEISNGWPGAFSGGGRNSRNPSQNSQILANRMMVITRRGIGALD
jgi:hypothetical protein